MKTLFDLDAKNYDDSMEEICRTAVRGVIFLNGKLLMIESELGELKLPGGGIDGEEDDNEALCREVKEETGYSVLRSSIVPFGKIEEKRLSYDEPKIWHQRNRLYFCDVDQEKGECSYTENEKKYGFHQVLYTIDEAIEKIKMVCMKKDIHPFTQREYKTLLALKEHLGM